MLNRKQTLIDVLKLLVCLAIAILIALVLVNTTNWPVWLQASVAGFTGLLLYWGWKQDYFKKLVLFLAAPDYSQHDAEVESALDIIEQHGMTAHLYLPAIGNREDPELSRSLDFLSSHGFIVTQVNGSLVGKVATARPDSAEVVSNRRAALKIVD